MDIEKLRKKINKIDEEIISLLVERVKIIKKIGEIKKEKGLEVFDKDREEEIIFKLKKKAEENGLNKDFVVDIYKKIIEESKKEQENV